MKVDGEWFQVARNDVEMCEMLRDVNICDRGVKTRDTVM